MYKPNSANISKKFTIGFAILPAAAGSAVTFLFVLVAFAGIKDLFSSREPTKLNKYEKIIVYPAFGFF